MGAFVVGVGVVAVVAVAVVAVVAAYVVAAYAVVVVVVVMVAVVKIPSPDREARCFPGIAWGEGTFPNLRAGLLSLLSTRPPSPQAGAF